MKISNKILFGTLVVAAVVIAVVYAAGRESDPRFSPYKSALGFEVGYPADFSVDENHTYDLVPGKSLKGTAFKVPESYRKGTNLSSDSYMAVEVASEENDKCSADSFLILDTRTASSTEKVGDKTYSVTSSFGVGAGNIYEETVYSTGFKPSSCLIARLFLHSNNIGIVRESDPMVREYDKSALNEIFRKMISSIKAE